jgi:hypothetical protein
MKNVSLPLLAAMVLMLALTGCGKTNFSPVAAAGLNANPAQKDQVPLCEINLPQAQIDGNVNAFELTGGGGIQVGYNNSTIFNGFGAQANVHIDVFQMDVSLSGTDPLSGAYIASTEVGSNQTKTNINASVDFSQITVGGGYENIKPIAKVSRQALTVGLKNLKSQLDKLSWIGRIIKRTDDNHLVLNHGALSGIEQGDTFVIYNVEHEWQDNNLPCNSTYYGSRRVPSTPAAIAYVQNSGDIDVTDTFLTIYGDEKVAVKLGAEVVIQKLNTDPANPSRQLKKKVFMGHVLARNITLPGNINFDLGAAMDSQIIDVLTNAGFVLEMR